MVTVQLKYPRQKARYLEMLLDSGADYTIISQSVASLLGIEYDKINTKEIETEMANFSIISTKETKIQLIIDEVEITIPILVSKKEVEPLLGRKGVFNAFDILFQERKNKVIFTKK